MSRAPLLAEYFPAMLAAPRSRLDLPAAFGAARRIVCADCQQEPAERTEQTKQRTFHRMPPAPLADEYADDGRGDDQADDSEAFHFGEEWHGQEYSPALGEYQPKSRIARRLN